MTYLSSRRGPTRSESCKKEKLRSVTPEPIKIPKKEMIDAITETPINTKKNTVILLAMLYIMYNVSMKKINVLFIELQNNVYYKFIICINCIIVLCIIIIKYLLHY